MAAIRPEPDDQINKIQTIEYLWPDDQTERPNFTGRPNIKHIKNTCNVFFVPYSYPLFQKNNAKKIMEIFI